MNKKSTYLIIALLFVIGALGWELLMKDKQTEKEQEEIEKEAEKIPDPEGIKVYENTSQPPLENGLRIGVESINSGTASCNFIYPNQKQEHEYMDINEPKHFTDNANNGYDIILRTTNKDEKGEYAIFEIVKNNTITLSYEQKKELETQEKQKIIDEAIKIYESRINENIEDAFLDSNEKESLDREYRDNWDASKTRKCTINNIRQYREKRQELPQGYSLYEYYLTYYFKVSVDTPDGIKVFRCDFKVGVTYDDGIANINDKIDVISFNEI